ncbi:sulfite exporter TauE/SafE family protein [Streptomyces sp. NBC_01262]|uniref:sulfite exporter TauE/SafE family protein n=1 Tax=Streptomyces sp. NBC_01262 TaxID=2903803 RepID=UPI002E343629|nr:sulfite exporter TauE/SafE family protein [Streptomyces sp. NBC_01262]
MTELILALIAGGAVGLSLGALGGGGSVLAVPALIYLLHMAPSEATTASLLIVAATSVTGLLAHARAGNVRWKAGAAFAVAGLPLAVVVGALSHRLPQTLLTVAFVLLAAAAAWRMLRTGAPDRGAGHTVRPGRAALAGAGLGGVTGLLGVGGGFLAVPALVTALGFAMPQAVATSLLVIAANALAALAARLPSSSGLDWALVGPFLGAAVLGAWDGKRIAAKVPAHRLQRAFAALLLTVAFFMLADALW